MAPTSPLKFPAEEYLRRRDLYLAELSASGVDVAVLSIRQNMAWLTGLGLSSANATTFLVLPRRGDPVWIVRRTEHSNVRALAPHMWVKDGIPVPDSSDIITTLAETLKERGFARARIGFEAEALFYTIGHHSQLTASLPDAIFVDLTGIAERLRRCKTPAEITCLKQAGAYSRAGMLAGFEELREGATENDVVAAMVGATIRAGSDRMGSMPFVSSGPETAQAHRSWTNRPIQRGAVINVEMAAACSHYQVPVFRVYSLGQPSDEIRRMHDASEIGLHAGLEGIKPGMTSHEAEMVVKRAVEATGYEPNRVVRAAYGIGLSMIPGWGESSVMAIKPRDQRVLQQGMCFHLVPALYADGVGAVCCSMPITITDTGVEPLIDLEPKLFVA